MIMSPHVKVYEFPFFRVAHISVRVSSMKSEAALPRVHVLYSQLSIDAVDVQRDCALQDTHWTLHPQRSLSLATAAQPLSSESPALPL